MKLFDLHCDTALACYKQSKSLKQNDLHLSLDDAGVFDKYAQVFAVWLDDALSSSEAHSLFFSTVDYFKNQLAANDIQLCLSASDIGKSRVSPILALEGCRLLMGDLQQIDVLYDAGVRLITLTWNAQNELAGGVLADPNATLTSFGKAAVRKMEEKGIVLDASHLNDKSFWSLAKNCTKPFIASHSNARSVCQNPRNLTDEQIKFIASSKGLIGLNFYKFFLSDSGSGTFDDALMHINKMLDLGCENSLAIGADFDGADMSPDFDGVNKMPMFYSFLIASGIDKKLCDKIFYKNACNYFTNCF